MMGTINPAYQKLEGLTLKDTPFTCQNLPVGERVSASLYNTGTVFVCLSVPHEILGTEGRIAALPSPA